MYTSSNLDRVSVKRFCGSPSSVMSPRSMENLQKKYASDRNYRSGERKKQFGKQRQGIGNQRLSIQKMRITHVVYGFLPLLRCGMQVGVRDLEALMTGEVTRHCCAALRVMLNV